MKTYRLSRLGQSEIEELCRRRSIDFASAFDSVRTVLKDVRREGDRAVKRYARAFDGVKLESLAVERNEIEEACSRIAPDVQRAFEVAAANIEKFHRSQAQETRCVETAKGVICFREMRPIEKVGLYLPGGTSPLPSTALMLGVPAKVAGCGTVILCTPPREDGSVSDTVIYAARLCGITRIFKVGGAHAVAAMGYGTESIPKVCKIFGPGNQYVTAAKILLAAEPGGVAIDLPAGPTEVLVIADMSARGHLVASDLLSQAEHGVSSQVALVCTDERKTGEILAEVEKQVSVLPRKEIAVQALRNSFALVVESIEQAIDFSNSYAPEHMVLNVEAPDRHIEHIMSAGSVFLGPYSCVSAGDYATGPNHTLPTYGYARMYGGLSLESFVKQITFQKVTEEGVRNLGPVVARMAEVEGLEGHKRAVEARYTVDTA